MACHAYPAPERSRTAQTNELMRHAVQMSLSVSRICRRSPYPPPVSLPWLRGLSRSSDVVHVASPF
eukprot:8942138-Pyramimonas_sp.AAC.1